jgi:hypothetical protein
MVFVSRMRIFLFHPWPDESNIVVPSNGFQFVRHPKEPFVEVSKFPTGVPAQQLADCSFVFQGRYSSVNHVFPFARGKLDFGHTKWESNHLCGRALLLEEVAGEVAEEFLGKVVDVPLRPIRPPNFRTLLSIVLVLKSAVDLL